VNSERARRPDQRPRRHPPELQKLSELTSRTASWAALEQFTALRYFTLDGSDYPSHSAQEAAIAGYVRWTNRRARPKQQFAVGSKIRRPDYLPNVA
jgi:hypothetical protein